MTRIAISGHRGFSSQVADLIGKAIRQELAPFAQAGDLVGVTCLADGADQIFAQAVLDIGGDLQVVIPAEHYRDGLPAHAQPAYDELLAKANAVQQLDHVESNSTAHMVASIAMLERADRLFAVWDGQPARGYGGTADVVNHAQELRLPVTVIWPEGARRD